MIRRFFTSKNSFNGKLRQLIGFTPSNFQVYEVAFRHRSISDTNYESNERLEFLGDAILSAVVANYLFKKFPYKPEGYLTDMRSKIVSRTQLNTIANKMGIDHFLKYNSADTLLNKKTIAGNALEALVGAIYLDNGFIRAEKFILKKIIKPFIDIEEIEFTEFNYKSKLLEWSQKLGKNLSFEVKHHNRQRHHSLYKIAALIDGEECGCGEGSNKKVAEKIAAKDAFEKLKIPVGEFI